MHFVDRKRLTPCLPFCSPGQPRPIAKTIAGLKNDRTSIGRNLHQGSVRISLEKLAPATLHLVFVELSRLQCRNEKFPYARAAERPHWMLCAIPFIEVTDDADGFCIR